MHHRKAFLLFLIGLVFFGAGCISEAPSLAPTDTPEPPSQPTDTIQWFPPTKTPTLIATQAVSPTVVMNPGITDLLYTDYFNQDSAWQTFSKNEGNAAIANNRLTLTIPNPANRTFSLLQGMTFTDFYLEITANPVLCRSGDAYGVLFRVNSILDYYRLVLNCNGRLRLERVRNGIVNALQDWTPSSQVVPGAGLTARIGIWANGADLRIFVNDVYEFGVIDATYASGQVGVHARSEGSTAVTVNFSNLDIFSLQP